MGHYVWKISIYDEKGNELLVESLKNKLYFLPIYYSSLINSYYSPWSSSGEIICLHEVTRELEIQTKFYSIKNGDSVNAPVDQVTSLICSPYKPELLLIGFDSEIENWRPFVVDFNGEILCKLPFSNIPLNMFVSWLPENMGFILINYNVMMEEYDLYYYNQVSDHYTSKITINPTDLVPYNENDHKTLLPPQSPITTPKETAFGKFIKEWNNIGFEIDSSTLIFRYLRPYGASYLKDQEEYSYIQEYESRYRLKIEKEEI